MHALSRLLPAIAAGLMLPGCAFAPQLQRVAVDHDQMVAQTEDELTLRNILRARDRYPLHFTAVTEVNGDAQLSVGASLGGTIASGGGDSVSPGVAGNISTRPSFRAAVLATEKFQRGLQQPVSGALIAYYLDAGWPDELLMALFVERIDVIDKQSRRRLASIHNDPNDAYAFESVICNFVLRSHRIEDRYELATATEVFKPADLQGLSQKDRADALQEFVDLLKDDKVAFDTERLSFKTNSSYSVTFTRGRNRCAGADYSRTKDEWKRQNPSAGLADGEVRNGLAVEPGNALLDERRFVLIGPSREVDGGYNARYLPSAIEGAATGERPDWHEVSLEVHFRSVQDVIYFIGEYVRDGGAAYQIPREYFLIQCGATPAAPVRRMRWILKINDGDAAGAISTRFLGRRYSLPHGDNEGEGACGEAGGESSRSLQVVALVQQLLNLNKSADQLPTSISITAIP